MSLGDHHGTCTTCTPGESEAGTRGRRGACAILGMGTQYGFQDPLKSHKKADRAVMTEGRAECTGRPPRGHPDLRVWGHQSSLDTCESRADIPQLDSLLLDRSQSDSKLSQYQQKDISIQKFPVKPSVRRSQQRDKHVAPCPDYETLSAFEN